VLKGECSIIGYTLMKVTITICNITLEGELEEVLTALVNLEKNIKKNYKIPNVNANYLPEIKKTNSNSFCNEVMRR
jgi:hypothetical protein